MHKKWSPINYANDSKLYGRHVTPACIVRRSTIGSLVGFESSNPGLFDPEIPGLDCSNRGI